LGDGLRISWRHAGKHPGGGIKKPNYGLPETSCGRFGRQILVTGRMGRGENARIYMSVVNVNSYHEREGQSVTAMEEEEKVGVYKVESWG